MSLVDLTTLMALAAPPERGSSLSAAVSSSAAARTLTSLYVWSAAAAHDAIPVSQECRHTSRVESCRRANRRYRRSPKGRRNQRRRQKRYRARRTSQPGATAATKTSASVSATTPLTTATTVPEFAASCVTSSTVTHQGSLPPAPDVFVSSGRPAVPPGLGSLDCCMCGRSVSDHLRYTFLSGEDPG